MKASRCGGTANRAPPHSRSPRSRAERRESGNSRLPPAPVSFLSQCLWNCCRWGDYTRTCPLSCQLSLRLLTSSAGEGVLRWIRRRELRLTSLRAAPNTGSLWRGGDLVWEGWAEGTEGYFDLMGRACQGSISHLEKRETEQKAWNNLPPRQHLRWWTEMIRKWSSFKPVVPCSHVLCRKPTCPLFRLPWQTYRGRCVLKLIKHPLASPLCLNPAYTSH